MPADVTVHVADLKVLFLPSPFGLRPLGLGPIVAEKLIEPEQQGA